MDYFKILGINKNATDKEIKIAYRKLAKKYHPDTYKGDKSFAENKMKEINEAYDILSNESKRKEILSKESYTTSTYHQTQNSTNTPPKKNYSSSNYEEGSVYDFDKHFNRKYNQTYSSYNYNPYVDENDSANMYYIDFSKLKKKLFKGIKHAFLTFSIVLILVIVLIVFLVNMLFKSLNDFFDSINTKPSITYNQSIQNSPTSNTESLFTNEDEYQQKLEELNKFIQENQEALDRETEEFNKAYKEWYNTEGKVYEEELNEFLKELEKEWQNY